MFTPRLGAAAIAAAVATSPALGADLSRPYPAPYVAASPFSAYNWNGAYVGLNLGFQWGSFTNTSARPSGVAGGAQAGYNFQYGQFVFGGETDIQLSGADDTFGAYKFSNPWFGTLRGRGGVAYNNVLLYLTAGLAYGEGQVDLGALSETNTGVGWTAGGGIEVGLTPNWSARAEYLFIDLSNHSYVLTGTGSNIDSSLVRLGVNYRF